MSLFLLLTEINDKEDAAIVAEKILGAFREQFILGDYKLSIGISMGISIYPDDGIDSDTLFRKADTALYQVKKAAGIIISTLPLRFAGPPGFEPGTSAL